MDYPPHRDQRGSQLDPLFEHVAGMRRASWSYRQIAAELNDRHRLAISWQAIREFCLRRGIAKGKRRPPRPPVPPQPQPQADAAAGGANLLTLEAAASGDEEPSAPSRPQQRLSRPKPRQKIWTFEDPDTPLRSRHENV